MWYILVCSQSNRGILLFWTLGKKHKIRILRSTRLGECLVLLLWRVWHQQISWRVYLHGYIWPLNQEYGQLEEVWTGKNLLWWQLCISHHTPGLPIFALHATNHFKRFLVFFQCFASFINLKKKVPYCFLDLKSFFSLKFLIL